MEFARFARDLRRQRICRKAKANQKRVYCLGRGKVSSREICLSKVCQLYMKSKWIISDIRNGRNGRNHFDHWRLKSRNSRNDIISHDFSYLEKTKNKRCTISVNIAPIRMKQLPFDSSRLDESNELIFIEFRPSKFEIFAIVFRNPDFFI